VFNLNDDLLLIPDPNGWIKNVEISLDGRYEHRLALCLFNNEDAETSTVIQSFNFFLEEEDFNTTHADLFENMTRRLLLSMEEAFHVSSKAIVLVIHDDLSLARRILGSIMEVSSEFNFPTAAAFVTDRVTWEDVLLSRVGKVDSTIITNLQLDKIVDSTNSGQRFNADGTKIEEN